ncbi:MAG: hypothetical protein ACJ71N_04180 [Terriglobales bacterium]
MLASLTIFCATAAYELHRFIGEPNGLPAIAALVAYYLTSAAIALWVYADAHHRGRTTAYDFASFVFILWPVLAPIYLVRSRGVRAFGPVGAFIASFVGGLLFAAFLGYPASLNP